MPFKSEKQRRYLWATQPALAKRWAKEYPESNKGLPMYANDEKKDDEKKARDTNSLHFPHSVNYLNKHSMRKMQALIGKTADSKQQYVTMPSSDSPTYAGEEREKGLIQGGEIDATPDTPSPEKPKRQNAINELLQKISTIIAPGVRQYLEDRKARQEGRDPRREPTNLGVKKYPAPSVGIPLPMGMASQGQAPGASRPAAQAASTSPPPVGRGGNPMANPIQSFGAISKTNNLTGNASFGTKHSPLSSKTATAIQKWASIPAEPRAVDSSSSTAPPLRHQLGSLLNKIDMGTGLGWGIAGTQALNVPMGLANRGYVKLLDKSWGETQDTPEWKKMLDYIKREAPAANVTSMQQFSREGRKALPTTDNPILNWWLKRQGKALSGLKQAPGAYNPMLDTIMYNTKYKTPAILAHELGHRMGGKMLLHGNALGRSAGGLGTIGALMATDEDTSRNRALAGTVGFAPTLISEVDASRRGAQILSKLKLPGKWKAFAGLPTYMLAGTAPMMAHYGKKYFGGFEPAKKAASSPAWQRAAGKNEEGGLNEKGRKSYERETGGNLKAPVTESNPKGEAKKRQNSFCSRMCGMKRVNTGASTAKDPDSRINKALRKWNCKCGSDKQAGETINLLVPQVNFKEDKLPALYRALLGAGVFGGLGLRGGALAGGIGGTIHGAVTNPGEYVDAKGHRQKRTRLQKILHDAVAGVGIGGAAGGALGAAGGAALPFLPNKT